MTYCVGILVDDGLVMIADTRTNAGVDNIATFRKLHLFEVPGERVITLATAGNLSASQSVLSLLSDGIEDPDTGEVETLLTVPSMYRAAQLVGRVIRQVYAVDGAEMEKRSMSFDVTMLLGGQIGQGAMRLYQVYSAGNAIEATQDTPFLQIGEPKYGKPILDRAADPVGDLVIARVCRLDVAAQAVEAELLRLAELILEELHRRHGADRVRIVVLVEGGSQVERLPVEVERTVAGLDGAEAEMVADRVQHLAVAGEFQADPVQVRLVRRPGMHVADCEFERHAGDADLGLVRLVEDHLARRIADLDADLRLGGERPGEEHPRRDDTAIALGNQADAGHVIADATLEVHRLPDSGQRAVPGSKNALETRG